MEVLHLLWEQPREDDGAEYGGHHGPQEGHTQGGHQRGRRQAWGDDDDEFKETIKHPLIR